MSYLHHALRNSGFEVVTVQVRRNHIGDAVRSHANDPTEREFGTKVSTEMMKVR